MLVAITIITGLSIALAGIAIGWVSRELFANVRFHKIKVGQGYGWVIAW